VALLGPSGSGKTTILRMIAGLETPSFGDIYIDGKRVNDVPANQREIGFVFQNYALFRHMTVYDNIAFGLKLKKVPKDEIKKRVTELLDITGLAGLEKRYPNQLSGGQRQRVAFARALAPNPSVLLLDEPFAAIDAKVRTELRTWLRSMVTRLGITSIFVTHDQDEAVEVAEGLNTEIGEKGTCLSGGEKQRLALARLWFENPELVILDEATSAMDNLTEENVMKSVMQKMKDKTVIAIAHRLNSIAGFDRIILFKEGRIVGQGTFEELLHTDSYFMDLYNANVK
jgi:ABC-type sulfate/molybdate transport systems ATPase subunit